MRLYCVPGENHLFEGGKMTRRIRRLLRPFCLKQHKPSRLMTLLALLIAASAVAQPIASARTFYCFGKPATIVGTGRADTIYGTAGDDVIYAGGGADGVLGEPLDAGDEPIGRGNDLICGGPGNDNVLTGLYGDDKINGGDGDDNVGGRSELGSDVLQGNAGNDFLRDAYYDSGHNVFRGGTGNDRLLGGDYSSSTMYGGNGNDQLSVLAPYVIDYLYGEAGADSIDSRDWVQATGQPPDTFTPDVVNGGTNPSGTIDLCRVNNEDNRSACESVQEGY
jgi:Ca2+-binding RTX toxin-like protein